MNWSSGFSASYYMTTVDPVTWLDLDRIEITGGSIDRVDNGLRQSADIDCKDYQPEVEQWIRVYLDAKQGDTSDHVPLFTGLGTSPSRNIKGTWEENGLQCFSVLKPADDVILERGWFAPAGENGADLIKQLLRPTPAPVEVDGTAPALTETIIAENGETNLTMVEKILGAMAWQLRITGRGDIVLAPYDSDYVAMFDPIENDVIETDIKVSMDLYSCPNVFMAVSDDMTSVARDEDENSPLSIQNRGREVWMYEGSCYLADDESISEYAMRRLKEEQQYSIAASYNRRYNPEIFPGDIIRISYPEQELDGYFVVESQNIELSHGARTSEQVINV